MSVFIHRSSNNRTYSIAYYRVVTLAVEISQPNITNITKIRPNISQYHFYYITNKWNSIFLFGKENVNAKAIWGACRRLKSITARFFINCSPCCVGRDFFVGHGLLLKIKDLESRYVRKFY